MPHNQLQKDVVRTAMATEIRARDFYSQTAARIANPRGRRRFERLSSEEEGHRRLLDRRYRSLLGDAGSADLPASAARFDLRDGDFSSQSGALEVVSGAIAAETAAIEFYRVHLVAVTDPEDVRLLRRLVAFERRHRRKLQREYRRLSRRYRWV